MSVVKTLRKAAIERRRLYLDYGCWLPEGEALTNMQVTTSPYTEAAPIVVNNGFADVTHRKLVMYVSGGVGNTSYVLSLVASTDAGQIKRDDIGLMVTP
jgi:hypothetical protein